MAKEFLQMAVNRAGSQVALAACIRARMPESRVMQGHIWNWLNGEHDEVPPAEYVLAISDACGWKITPHQLRPDIYPHPMDGLPRKDCACREAA